MLFHVRSGLGCYEVSGTNVSFLPIRTLVSSGSLALQASTSSLPREQLTLIKRSDSCGIGNNVGPLWRWRAEVCHPKVRAINLGCKYKATTTNTKGLSAYVQHLHTDFIQHSK